MSGVLQQCNAAAAPAHSQKAQGVEDAQAMDGSVASEVVFAEREIDARRHLQDEQEYLGEKSYCGAVVILGGCTSGNTRRQTVHFVSMCASLMRVTCMCCCRLTMWY